MSRVSSIKVTEVFTFDKSSEVRETQDGFIVANPRVGRVGIQLYQGKELGRPDMEVVRVWRPEHEVMDKAAMASICNRPVTNDHPNKPVTKENWKDVAGGHAGDTVTRDGDYVRCPLILMDKDLIRDYRDGKKELSLGYSSDIVWQSGTAPETGEMYDAVQTRIRVNHIAVVDAARGGPKLAIGDSVSLNDASLVLARKAISNGVFMKTGVLDEDPERLLYLDSGNKYPFGQNAKVYRSALESIKAEAGTNQHTAVADAAGELLTLIDNTRTKKMTEKKMTTIVIDSIPCEMDDVAASVVLRRVKALETESADLAGKLQKAADKAKEEEEKSKKESEAFKKKNEEDAATIVTLKKQAEDNAITPQKLDAMVADRALTAGKARAVLGDKLVVTGKTEADMRRQVVDAKLGDSAKGWSDDQVAASFATLTAGVKADARINTADQAVHVFSGQPTPLTDRETAQEANYDKYNKRIEDAWKQGGAPAKQ